MPQLAAAQNSSPRSFVRDRKSSHFDPVLREDFLPQLEILTMLHDTIRSCMSRSRVALFPHNIPVGTLTQPTPTQSERCRTKTPSAAGMRAGLSPSLLT
jgi:hypothetical protein